MTAASALTPPAVVPGDRIGVAALSGAVPAAQLARGLERLEALGFEPVLADNISNDMKGSRDPSPGSSKSPDPDLPDSTDTEPYALAGTDEERLAGFHDLLTDDSIGAVLFARGGHGLLRVLPRIDWRLLARRPRSFVGYSDLTPFLGQVVERLGWQTLHGPMVASDLGLEEFGRQETESLVRALAGDFSSPLPLRPIPGVASSGPIEAPLAGGCLSLLAATLGTEHSCDCRDRILFIEDHGEPDYRIDRMLTHLDLSGKFVGISALLIGHLRPQPQSGDRTGWRRTEISKQSGESFKTSSPDVEAPRPLWLQGLVQASERYGWPVFQGIPAGHGRPNLTLPLGRRARVDAALGTLSFL